MKKKIIIMLIVSLLLFSITTPVFADAGGINWALWCKHTQPDAFAECMKSPAHYCGDHLHIFKNHGTCVSYYMAHFWGK